MASGPTRYRSNRLRVRARALTNNVAKRVSSPPVDGKANKELIEFLSKLLSIRKSDISIIKGETGRSKLLSIEGMETADIVRCLGI